MKVVLLVSGEVENREEIKASFPRDYFLIDCGEEVSSEALLNDIAQGLILLDTDWPPAESWLKKTLTTHPHLAYIGFGREKNYGSQLSDYLYDFLLIPCDPWMLKKALDRGWEKISLSYEKNKTGTGGSRAEKDLERDHDFSSRPWARVLSDFSRALNNQFKRDKFLELFLDAVKELVPVGKLSVLLKSEETGLYTVVAQRGLDPAVLKHLNFSSSEGIVSRLSAGDHILYLSPSKEGEIDDYPAELIQEMRLLHASVCIPLVAHGRLKGILCLGSKLAGTAFCEKELELLYTVCGNVAIALSDIDLHDQLYNQKVYTESILQLMNSGVVAIDNNDRITTFNQRIGEILASSPEAMIGQDLRCLPSPLGDMLYETLATGRAYHKEEIELPRRKVPLEVSTYRMVNANDNLLGSVMIVDDISERKQAEWERRQAEQVAALNRFVSQLTHEIRNPMVAIQTFSELLPEKYDDSTFRQQYSQMVRQEVKRLNELINQLIAFSSPLIYKHEVLDIFEVIDSAVKLLHEQGKGLNISIKKNYCEQNPMVRVDKLSMSRAFSYLLNYLFESLGNEGTVFIETVSSAEDQADGEVSVKIYDSGTKVTDDDIKKLFDPLEISPDNNITLGLPVSKKIVEDQGGHLRAAPTNGQNLMFEIRLPGYLSEQEAKGEKRNA